jgi:uroporphyrinogen III methyltransferase/synthase
LLTIRGLAALRGADAVVYDRLVSAEVLAFVAPNVERIYAGKRSGAHAATQDEINKLLIRLAGEGKAVVRLKGGDPFVFGRGGEEAAALAAAGIRCEVVPGVTSAIAGPAAAGIPVTHRAAAATVAIVTAHAARGGAGERIDWGSLAGIDTVVLLMGIERLDAAARALIAAGRDPATPAAVVASATLPTQQTVRAPLAAIGAAAKRAGIRPPAVTVVGDVVALRDVLGGWDTRPLSGVRCLVTRTREQAGELSGVLRELGADVVEAPAIRIRPPASWAQVDRAVRALSDYEWIVLTSANGVRFFFDRLAALGKDARALGGVRVAAVGTGTAAALSAHGVHADLIPNFFTTEEVGRAFVRGSGRVLLAGADVVEPGLAEALAAKGWRCDAVALYRIRPVKQMDARTRRRVANGEIDVLTFASGGTVRAFVNLLGGKVPGSVKVACIGPVTAQTARAAGLRVDAVAAEHTIAGLAAAAVVAAGRVASPPKRHKRTGRDAPSRKMSESSSRTRRR